jgi:hypothetical protein
MVWRSLLAAAAAERLNLAHSGASAGGRRRREGDAGRSVAKPPWLVVQP